MSLLEKLAWVWLTINSELRKQEKKGNTKLFKYEKLFLSEDKESLNLLIDEITHWSDKTYVSNIPDDFLDRKVNVNTSYEFPKWEEWSDSEKEDVLKICGDLMEELEYDE